MTSCALTFLLVFYPLPGCLMRDAAPAQAVGGVAPIAAYGRADPRCAEWTDVCTVCVAADPRPRCSTPGIACTPAAPRCTRPATP